MYNENALIGISSMVSLKQELGELGDLIREVQHAWIETGDSELYDLMTRMIASQQSVANELDYRAMLVLGVNYDGSGSSRS